VIRAARSDEADALVSAYEWLFAPPGVRPPRWDPGHAAGRLREAIASGASEVLVADGDGDGDGPVVGICTVYLDLDSVRFGQRAWVEDLAVDPGQRSRGVGKQLLDAAKDWARSRGATHLELDSGEARADAHRFYEREGADYRSVCFGWEL
jgi:GNAT superfamily N-acetyltransferase